jgi:hypothetical protein
MNKKIIAVSFLIVAILFVSAFAGTISYYNNKIASQNNEIANLTSQIAKLNGVIANYPTANLTAHLVVTELLGNESNDNGKPTPIPYNYLYIDGSVSNSGKGTAYNAGLHVVAYDAFSNGTLDINTTVPLSGGIYGTDAATDAFVLENYGSYNQVFGVVDGEQTVIIGFAQPFHSTTLSILHEDTVSNWTITPVWTNLP